MANSLKEDIEELKESTVKLGKQLSEAAQENLFDTKKLAQIPKGIVSNMNKNIRQLREKMGEIADDATEQSKKVDVTVHKKPYWFIFGALGTGVFLGWLFRKKENFK